MTLHSKNVSWLVYSVLLFVRVVLAPFLMGYVHPDEFFQGGQELFFGCPPNIPWEFDPVNAVRSIVPPTLLTWLPLQIYDWLRVIFILIMSGIGRHGMISGMENLSGIEILIVPRLFCSVLSILVMDLSVWSICTATDGIYQCRDRKEKREDGVPIPVLLLASAWPTMVMLTRPFSNSMESYILALLMVTVLTKTRDKNSITFNCQKILFLCSIHASKFIRTHYLITCKSHYSNS